MGMKWTAFLTLKGETCTRRRDETPAEVFGLVQFLRGVDIDYNLIVFVEDEGSRVLPQNSQQSSEAWARREESGI
jgi:hypothetical protein